MQVWLLDSKTVGKRKEEKISCSASVTQHEQGKTFKDNENVLALLHLNTRSATATTQVLHIRIVCTSLIEGQQPRASSVAGSSC